MPRLPTGEGDTLDSVVQTPRERSWAIQSLSQLVDYISTFKSEAVQQVAVITRRINDAEGAVATRASSTDGRFSKDSGCSSNQGVPSIHRSGLPDEFKVEVRKRAQVMVEKTQVSHNLYSVLFKEIQQIAERVVRAENLMAAATKKQEAMLEELRPLSHHCAPSYNGTLLWTVDEVSRKMEEAVVGNAASIVSPPFFTSRAGYKLCGRLYLHGDGIGRGSYLSVFVALMKGKYDAILEWPFRQLVKMTLLDQSGRGQHVRDTFRADPSSSSFRRPRTEMNIAAGCPRFMSLTDLRTGWHNYVVDDQMLLEIKIDTTGLSNFGGQ